MPSALSIDSEAESRGLSGGKVLLKIQCELEHAERQRVQRHAGAGW